MESKPLHFWSLTCYCPYFMFPSTLWPTEYTSLQTVEKQHDTPSEITRGPWTSDSSNAYSLPPSSTHYSRHGHGTQAFSNDGGLKLQSEKEEHLILEEQPKSWAQDHWNKGLRLVGIWEKQSVLAQVAIEIRTEHILCNKTPDIKLEYNTRFLLILLPGIKARPPGRSGTSFSHPWENGRCLFTWQTSCTTPKVWIR